MRSDLKSREDDYKHVAENGSDWHTVGWSVNHPAMGGKDSSLSTVADWQPLWHNWPRRLDHISTQ